MTHMSQKQDISVVGNFIQTLVKPTTFLRLPKLDLKLFIWVDVFCRQKRPKQSISSISISIMKITSFIKHNWLVTTFNNCWLNESDAIIYSMKMLTQMTVMLSYGDCLEVKREYYQNYSVLDCVTQCSQSAALLYEQFLQVQQIEFVTLGPLRHLQRQLPRVVLL